jgi:hypothetical protein
MRKLMLLVAGTLLATSLTLAAQAQQPVAKPADPPALSFQAIEILDSDGALRKLLKARYNAAGEDLEARVGTYLGGRVDLGDMLACIERFAKAGVDVGESPAEQAAKLEIALNFAKKVEAIVKSKHEHEIEPVQSLKHATVVRLGLEIQLHRARELAKTAALTK